MWPGPRRWKRGGIERHRYHHEASWRRQWGHPALRREKHAECKREPNACQSAPDPCRARLRDLGVERDAHRLSVDAHRPTRLGLHLNGVDFSCRAVEVDFESGLRAHENLLPGGTDAAIHCSIAEPPAWERLTNAHRIATFALSSVARMSTNFAPPPPFQKSNAICKKMCSPCESGEDFRYSMACLVGPSFVQSASTSWNMAPRSTRIAREACRSS